MGIDNIEDLKPPPYTHNLSTCGGIGICLPCSTAFAKENGDIRQELRRVKENEGGDSG